MSVTEEELRNLQPGDRVWLKPVIVGEVEDRFGFRTTGGVYRNKGDIDRIEKAPRPPKVGDWGRRSDGTVEGEIVFVDGGEVVLRTKDDGLYIIDVDDLEPSESGQ